MQFIMALETEFFYSEMNDKAVVENRVEENSVNEVSGEPVEAAVTSESSSQTGGKGRQKHKCPYPSCSAKVVHLPGHMRQKHK